ncbi:MAG: MBOAT family O-acyltransferase [bacterium]|nr:MBOAT family O-acyltransferase [bacterium]
MYRGKYPAERHLGIYALYVMFFPQLVAGPIERPAHLLPQFRKVVHFEKGNVFSGIRLMAWGFFKKMVIADRLAFSVNYIYANVAYVSGPSIFFAMFAFSFQLYADFSGYTDIARGSARVLGIDLVRNFNQPYFSRSIAEFWRRWHISLSSWFRDYVYLPLVWNRKEWGIWWMYSAVVITFLLTGVWHGAAWTYIVMGLLFGLYIIIGLVTKPLRGRFSTFIGLSQVPRLHSALQIGVTFILTSVAFVFFRSSDLRSAGAFLVQMSVGWHISFAQFLEAYVIHPVTMLGIRNIDLALALGFIVVLLLVENVERRCGIVTFLDQRSLFVKSVVYSSLLWAILMFGIFTASTFIYFQF